MAAKATFTIGELAVRAGLTPDALRYYERLGVIPPVPRTAGGFRVYTVAVLERVRFIKQAQLHGPTLVEIRELLRLDGRGGRQCLQVQQLLTRKLADVDARLIELQEFRRTLGEYLARCDRTLAENVQRGVSGRRRSAEGGEVKAAIGSIGAAVVTSACCIGPVALSLLGVGALGAAAVKLEPYRPFFIAFTVGLVGVAFFSAYRPTSAQDGCEDSVCTPQSKRAAKSLAWIAAIVAAVLIAFPYYIGWFV
jgi:DNA-binding transcriptional MerR regulator